MSDSFYQCHVFCCTNKREPKDGVPPKRGCCASKGSDALREYMKKRARELGMERTRVNSAGCLDRCELGAVMVIYPEGAWYHYETEADVDEILQSHIINKTPVERLLLTNTQRTLKETL